MKHLLIYSFLFLSPIFCVYGQSDFYVRLADSAYTLTKQKVIYDASYTIIAYPNGDVPSHKGVCTDVIIRTYRKLGIDLQKEVHEDMSKNFNKYPQKWGLSKPDKNIDHRRVPNLMTFFSRHGTVLEISNNAADYKPGNIVCWDLGNGITHIGIISNKSNWLGTRYMVIHNIGAGQMLEDMLFNYEITGHYRFKK